MTINEYLIRRNDLISVFKELPVELQTADYILHRALKMEQEVGIWFDCDLEWVQIFLDLAAAVEAGDVL